MLRNQTGIELEWIQAPDDGSPPAVFGRGDVGGGIARGMGSGLAKHMGSGVAGGVASGAPQPPGKGSPTSVAVSSAL